MYFVFCPWTPLKQPFLQAFQCLLNLYILFQPSRSAEDPQASKQPIPMVLSDELQSHCAEFIQNEIERYVDLLDEERGEGKGAGSESDGNSSELSDEDGVKAKKSKKPKKDAKKGERAESEGAFTAYVHCDGCL